MKTLVAIFFVFVSSLFATTGAEVIKKIEDNLNGDTAYMKIKMEVTTKRATRTMVMESYSKGTKKSFIKILYPNKDKGITFLKLDNTMWQYVPKIEKVIKIPASMMLQSWMGSDFTNDDLVKESSLSKDYITKILKEDALSYMLELTPNENASVVWGKLNMEVDKKYFLPLKVEYYDEDGKLIRVLNYKNIKKLDDRFYPTSWQMLPQDKEKIGNITTIEVEQASFNKAIKESYFSKLALKNYSD